MHVKTISSEGKVYSVKDLFFLADRFYVEVSREFSVTLSYGRAIGYKLVLRYVRFSLIYHAFPHHVNIFESIEKKKTTTYRRKCRPISK